MTTTLRVQVPEISMDRLHDRAREQGRDLEATASLALIASLEMLPSMGRVVVLDRETIQTLEALFQGGSITNSADLLQKVLRLAGISFEHIRLQFTPGQLETLQEKAERQGKTVTQLVEQMAPRICDQFFGLIDNRG